MVNSKNILEVMMSEKKGGFKRILLIFFIVHLFLAFFLGKNLHIGKHPETGKFSLWLEHVEESMQDMISLEIQPDRYVFDNDIENPEQFTWGSKSIYNFFNKLFGSTGATNWFGERSSILNFRLWRMLIFLDIFLILLALYIRKSLSFIPTKVQLISEMAYHFIEDLVLEILGSNKKIFVPYFVTIFIFIWFSNQSGLLPIPGIAEPTRNLNVPVSLGIMAVAVVHFNAIKKKGLFAWAKGFCEPIFFLVPLNLIGEMSKVVSISFRLFGNIFGGAIIAVVVSSLTKYILVPVGLNMFFTLFAGTIQAFVFTMLALTYLSLEIND